MTNALLTLVLGVSALVSLRQGLRAYWRRGVEASTMLAINTMRMEGIRTPVSAFVLTALFWPIVVWIEKGGRERAHRFVTHTIAPAAEAYEADRRDSEARVAEYIAALDDEHFGRGNGHQL